MGCGESKQKEQNNKEANLNIAGQSKKQESKELEIKICLLGDVSVGKTSIASLFCKNSFNENYINAIGEAYQQQNILLNNGAKIKLHIWDASDQDKFRSMRNLYYFDTKVAICNIGI